MIKLNRLLIMRSLGISRLLDKMGIHRKLSIMQTMPTRIVFLEFMSAAVTFVITKCDNEKKLFATVMNTAFRKYQCE